MNISVVVLGLPLRAPDPLAHGLGGSETAGLQLAAELVRGGIPWWSTAGCRCRSGRTVKFRSALRPASRARIEEMLVK
jgi:hypothetical protein